MTCENNPRRENGTYNHGAHFISRAMFEKSTITLLTVALLTLPLALGMGGCAPLLISAAGAGAGAVFSHHANGQSTRTFTAPLPRARVAVIAALKKMSIKPSATEKTDLGERILAKAGGRSIEIELEVVTPSTTLMRTIARSESGLTLDSATATEITHQTEAAVGRG